MTKRLLLTKKKKNRLFLLLLLLTILFYIFTIFYVYQSNKELLYNNVDKVLKNSAYIIPHIINEDLQDRSINKDSITKEEDLKNIENISLYVKNIEIEYLYTMILKNDKIYFTSSSATQDDIDDNIVTYNFDLYESSTEKLRNVLKTNKITYEESTDKWGTFRTVFIPAETKKGTKYILGADIKIDYIEKELDLFKNRAISMFIVLLFLIGIIFIVYRNIVFKDIEEIKILEDDLKLEIKKQTNELLEQEKLLFKSEKMVSMGEMIGNIAHQWRQPLSVISTASTGIIMHKELGILDETELIETCNTINDNAQYLSKTIDDFQNFIKGDRIKKVFNLKDNINSFLHIVDSSIKNHYIKIIKDIDENIEINGYGNELIQCFINIFNNAKDALNENIMNNNSKLIFIKTSIDNNNITIKIKDNAGGIKEETLTKVFEPYFTTKYSSQGTGLGLHMTYNLIVNGMDGNIKVHNVNYEFENKKYFGAEFTIILPLS